MPLGARLALMVLLAALPIFVIQISNDLEQREARRQLIVERAESIAGQIALRLDSFVTAVRFLLTATSKLSAVRSQDAEACHIEMREIVTELPEVQGLAIIMPDGQALCSTAAPRPPVNIHDRPYFQEALKTRSFHVSGYLVGRVTGRGSLAFVYPVVEDEEIRHVAFLAASTTALSRRLADSPLPADAFVTVLDDDARVLARWPDPEKWDGRDLSDAGWIRAPAEHRRGGRTAALDGESGQYALGYAPMRPPARATIIVGLSLAAALQDADILFWQSLAGTSLVFLAAMAVAWLGAVYFVRRPIRQLSEQVDALAEGDDSRLAPTGGLPELRQLSEHFLQMSRALKSRQGELESAVQQKEVLLREVNHRVKNSLQLIASLFSLQRTRIRDPEVRHHFEDAMQRVSTVARVHQRLYEDQHFESVQFDRLLTEMCEELDQALSSERGIRMECRADECRLPTDKAIPLALIANELITNAFKYAYRDGKKGIVRVECRTEEATLVLEVADHGAPLPADFDLASDRGLGMRVVGALTKQIRGTIEIEPRRSGKAFVLKVPL